MLDLVASKLTNLMIPKCVPAISEPILTGFNNISGQSLERATIIINSHN